ncbi:glycosyltransferase [Alkalibacterium putridalgicola]|uniref:glycosyltransferase n=1 Tax=Alkalibacterium putridalgicola TaxID=426703 RepID=UPI0034CE76CA
MIFVTVGTHEQQFNRLVKEVDELVKSEEITETVFIQTGYSDYKPEYCEWAPFVSYKEMQSYIKKSRIVITHGGPSSFLNVLQYNKIPIVVPRLVKYGEHVNDHQRIFLEQVLSKGYTIKSVINEKDLGEYIRGYENVNAVFQSNNVSFVHSFSEIAENLLDESV